MLLLVEKEVVEMVGVVEVVFVEVVFVEVMDVGVGRGGGGSEGLPDVAAMRGAKVWRAIFVEGQPG